MDVAYVIGPYRSKIGAHGIKKNIDKAEDTAKRLWLLEFAVICPHKNTAFFDGIAPDEIWLQGDLELLSRSNLAVTVDGWEKSEGSTQEVNFCKENKIPVYHSIHEVMEKYKKLSPAEIESYRRCFENLP